MFEGSLKNVFPDSLLFYFYAGEGVGVGVALNEDLTVTENLAEGIRRTIQLFPNIRRFWDPCVLNNQITFRGLF